MSRLPRFTNMRKWCEQICHVHRRYLIYTFEDKSSFSIFISGNETQFSLENIDPLSADGVKKAYCQITGAALFRHLLRIVS